MSQNTLTYTIFVYDEKYDTTTARNRPQLPPAFQRRNEKSGQRFHHEIAAISIQPCSKASNESVNPDNAIIRIMRRSSEIGCEEADIITRLNKKMQTRSVVLSNANIPSTVLDYHRRSLPRLLPTPRGIFPQRTSKATRLVQNTESPRRAVWV